MVGEPSRIPSPSQPPLQCLSDQGDGRQKVTCVTRSTQPCHCAPRIGAVASISARRRGLGGPNSGESSDSSCSRAARCFNLSTSESPQSNVGICFLDRHERMLAATSRLGLGPHLNWDADGHRWCFRCHVCLSSRVVGGNLSWLVRGGYEYSMRDHAGPSGHRGYG